MTQYILLIILWIAWCALHSAIGSLSFTEPLRKRFPYAVQVDSRSLAKK